TVVSPLSLSSRRFLYISGAIDSRVATKRVPSSTPLAPSASAATSPRPSARPPAATTGTRTASTTCGSRDMRPTRSASGNAALPPIDRWPPASSPWATMTSAPPAAAARASSTVETIAMVLMPRARHSRAKAGSSQPRAAEKTGGRPARTTWSAGSTRAGGRLGRAPGGGKPGFWREGVSIPRAPPRGSLLAPPGSGGRPAPPVEPEIHADRPIGQLADAADHRAQVVGRHVEPGEDPEPAGATHFGDQLGPGDGAHARLDDGVLDPEEIAQRRAERHQVSSSMAGSASPAAIAPRRCDARRARPR